MAVDVNCGLTNEGADRSWISRCHIATRSLIRSTALEAGCQREREEQTVRLLPRRATGTFRFSVGEPIISRAKPDVTANN